jgi:Ca-activated chloride channel family protein
MYFLYPLIFLSLALLSIVGAFIAYRYKGIIYHFPAIKMVSTKNKATIIPSRRIMWFIRLIILLLLAIVGARLIFHTNNAVRMNGIDIMLVMDVSGSMELFDDIDDRRSRLLIAKQEAQKFTESRLNDSVGIIIFAAGAAVRCPITFDKKMVHDILGQLSINSLNPDGTWLSTALAQAARKLSDSDATSKIIIALTDGSPSPDDLQPNVAIDLLKEFGIKVYTIGIGSPKGGLIEHPMYGIVTIPTPLNGSLLKHIADQTGGQYFEAKNAHDMARIYKTIDTLEKSERDIPWWLQGYEYKQPLLWLIFCMAVCEILLRLVWVFV